MIEWIKINT